MSSACQIPLCQSCLAAARCETQSHCCALLRRHWPLLLLPEWCLQTPKAAFEISKQVCRSRSCCYCLKRSAVALCPLSGSPCYKDRSPDKHLPLVNALASTRRFAKSSSKPHRQQGATAISGFRHCCPKGMPVPCTRQHLRITHCCAFISAYQMCNAFTTTILAIA